MIRRLLLLFVLALAASESAFAYYESNPGCNSRRFGTTRHTALAPNGDVVVTGCLHSGGTLGYDTLLTMRYSGATGQVLWAAQHRGASGNSGAAAVAIDAAGDVVVTGFASEIYGQHIRTIKYDGATGAQRWSAAYKGYGTSQAYAIALDAAGNVFVTGESKESTGGRHMRTVKYDGATGTQRWTAALHGSFDGFAIGEAIVVDGHGDVFVTGVSGENVGGSNLRTVKYDGQTGALAWTHQMGVAGDDSGLAAVLDPSGSLLVAGYTYEPGSGADYCIVKYQPSTGAILWTRTIAGTPIAGDTGEALATDAAGNVYVTGFADGGGYNWRTAKLDAMTGNIVWNVPFDGPGHGDDFAFAIAVDAAGDVVVTGGVAESPVAMTGRTIKYRNTDGAELWNAADPESGLGLVTDAARNVFVTTHAANTDDGYGYRVLKYAAATGVPHWVSTPTLKDAPVDMTVAMSRAPGPVAVGRDLVLTVTATNASATPASGVTLTYYLPSGAYESFVWASPGCAYYPSLYGTGVICALGSLAGGASGSVTVVVRPTLAGPATLHAGVRATEPDPSPTSNGASIEVDVAPTPPGVPVTRYRLYSPGTLEHLFTTDLNEYTVLGATGAWVQEGTAGRVLDNPGSFDGVTAIPYYRLYNMFNHWHHWTTDTNEYYTLVQFAGWIGEGVDGFLLPVATAGAKPLYRLLYPNGTGLHHWTVDAHEYATLISTYGWVGEGGSGYVIE